MRELELGFLIRIENERIATEEKSQKKIDIIVREMMRRHKMQDQISTEVCVREAGAGVV